MTETATPPTDLVREELARLMDSEAMRRAPSHARLLRYLVERRVAGDDVALRETSIALEVFRRDPATYDPRTDPIVRVSIGRLRERLDAHYAHYEAPPRLRILLPKGRYAPEFLPIVAASAGAGGIAVLAVRDLTGAAGTRAPLADFADRLTDRLASAGLPQVIARASVAVAESASADPRRVAAKLGASWLVDSTLAREGRRGLRLSVRLVGADGEARWIETGVAIPDDDLHPLLDRLTDVATLRVAETVPGGAHVRAAGALAIALPDAARTALERSRLLVLQRTVPATDAAVDAAQTVVRDHPDSADAWATLAATLYSRLAFHDLDPAPLVERTNEAARRALALDPGHPVALRTRATLAGKGEGDLDEALSLFARALAAAPQYTSARLNHAELLTLAGRGEDANVQLNLARLHDPLSASVHLARAVCLQMQRRYADADEAWALARAAGETSVWVAGGEAWTALAAGRLDEALAKIEDAHRRMPGQGGTLVCLASVAAARGDPARALEFERECAERFPWHSPAQRAIPAAHRRDRETTLALLTEAVDRRDLGLLGATMDPAFDWLAGDRDFARLKRRHPIWAGRGT
jgi:TolB-like protein/Tfp pilus assembly protein PilF